MLGSVLSMSSLLVATTIGGRGCWTGRGQTETVRNW